jgi:hypothetical protein
MGGECWKHILKYVRFHKITSFVSFVALQNQDISRHTNLPTPIKESPWISSSLRYVPLEPFPYMFPSEVPLLKPPHLANFPKE